MADKLSKDLITSCLKPSVFQVVFKMQKYKVMFIVCKSLQQLLACKHRNKSSYSPYIVLESSYSQHTVKIIENMSDFFAKKVKDKHLQSNILTYVYYINM